MINQPTVMTAAARIPAAALLTQMECGGDLTRYLTAYQDGGGAWTIGCGSTVMLNGQRATRHDAISHADALALLKTQTDAWDSVTANTVTVSLADAWLAVLVSFVDQEGIHALPGSVLADMLNASMFPHTARQLNGWVIATAHGISSPQLGITPMQQAVKQALVHGAGAPYRTACSDALRHRNGAAAWPVHPAVHDPISPTDPADAPNAAEITKIGA